MILRTYRRIAQTEHWCDRCCTHILPGEEYEGRVEIYRRGKRNRIIVWKEHINPCCEPPDPPDEDFLENEEESDFELPKAA